MIGFRSSTLSLKEIKSRFKVGDVITLSGWVYFVRKSKEINFIGLKDSFGSIQVVIQQQELLQPQTKLEDVLTIKGILQHRQGKEEEEFELHAEEVRIENRAKHPLPLEYSRTNNSEQQQQIQTPQQRDASLRYRYLDLRQRTFLNRNLRLRGKVQLAMRNFMTNEYGFLEIETPTLFKSTPEGAKEFLVPVTRDKEQQPTHPRFYALVQSPQQYKQMLMVGGMDRYFQFARCYRDEGGRADRQPEFTQLDLEMSFVRDSKHVQNVIEGVVCHGWKTAFDAYPDIVPSPPQIGFKSMKLSQAMEKYGSDKPNATFGMIIQNNQSVIAPFLSEVLSKREFSSLYKIFEADKVRMKTINKIDIEITSDSLSRLGRGRLLLAEWMKKKEIPLPEGEMKPYTPFWVTDFGMFEKNDETGLIGCVHNPFTAPHVEDLPKLIEYLENLRNSSNEEDKEKWRSKLIHDVRALHYDLVCDGIELGGGSIRIHSGELQKRVFIDALGLSELDCQNKFSQLLDALNSGAPPHGGFAIGFDRFIAMLCGSNSLTDTLAFPKSSMGTDPLTGAPCPLSLEEEKSVLYNYALRSEI